MLVYLEVLLEAALVSGAVNKEQVYAGLGGGSSGSEGDSRWDVCACRACYGGTRAVSTLTGRDR